MGAVSSGTAAESLRAQRVAMDARNGDRRKYTQPGDEARYNRRYTPPS